MLGLWCVCLLGQRELARTGEDPGGLSAAAVIKAFQSTLREYRVRPETREEGLWAKLSTAILDDYQRTGSKTSRNYPRKKKRHKIGAPKITPASKQQINTAKTLKQTKPQFQLPA